MRGPRLRAWGTYFGWPVHVKEEGIVELARSNNDSSGGKEHTFHQFKGVFLFLISLVLNTMLAFKYDSISLACDVGCLVIRDVRRPISELGWRCDGFGISTMSLLVIVISLFFYPWLVQSSVKAIEDLRRPRSFQHQMQARIDPGGNTGAKQWP
jgi:hypothetical protein